jgi:hypothetical protein
MPVLEDAIKAEAADVNAADLSFTWNGSKLTVKNDNANTAAVFADAVTADITDASRNNTTAGAVLIDSDV